MTDDTDKVFERRPTPTLDKPESPFQPGARVVIVRYNHARIAEYTESRVEKLHKTGRFTLLGDSQQWTPRGDRLRAHQSGNAGYYARPHVLIWNDQTDAEIIDGMAKADHFRRLVAVRRRIDRLATKDIEPAALAQIEALLPPETKS